MKPRIDAGILAGGLASRMQGQDKGLQLYKHKPMAKWVYEALAPSVERVIINCNRNTAAYREISTYICADEIDGFLGPLAGLHSLMCHSDADYLLVSPCDTPLLGEEFAQIMLSTLTKLLQDAPDSHPIIAACDAERQHPLHLLISTQYRSELKSALENGHNRVMKWMQAHHATWVNFSEEAGEGAKNFVNFNTFEALAEAEDK